MVQMENDPLYRGTSYSNDRVPYRHGVIPAFKLWARHTETPWTQLRVYCIDLEDNSVCMFLNVWGNPECPEKTYIDTGRAYKLHTDGKECTCLPAALLGQRRQDLCTEIAISFVFYAIIDLLQVTPRHHWDPHNFRVIYTYIFFVWLNRASVSCAAWCNLITSVWIQPSHLSANWNTREEAPASEATLVCLWWEYKPTQLASYHTSQNLLSLRHVFFTKPEAWQHYWEVCIYLSGLLPR